MEKKKIIALSVLTAAALMIGGVLIYHFNNKDNSVIEYASVEAVIKDADSVIGTEYENIKLPKELNIDISGDIYLISADYSKNCEKKEKLTELAQLMIPGQKIEISEDGSDCIVGKSENASIWYYDDSTFAYAREELTIPTNQLKDGKKYIIGKDSLDDKYVLNGENYSIKEAVDYAEGFAKDKLMPFLVNDSGLKAESACAFKVDEQNYWIYVQLTHYIEGCPVSTSGSVINDGPYMRPQQLVITIDGRDQICHIENNYYANIIKKEKIDKIVTLASALKHLEKELAPGSNYSISNISLCYCARINDIGSKEFEYRPMWCFTVSDFASDNIDINPRKTIYVDAQNGEVSCFSDFEKAFVF